MAENSTKIILLKLYEFLLREENCNTNASRRYVKKPPENQRQAPNPLDICWTRCCIIQLFRAARFAPETTDKLN